MWSAGGDVVLRAVSPTALMNSVKTRMSQRVGHIRKYRGLLM